MFPKAQTAWSLTLACGDANRLINNGTAPTRDKTMSACGNVHTQHLPDWTTVLV